MEGCLKFLWVEVWYDELEIFFGGFIVTCAVVMFASVFLFVFMREVGMNLFGFYKDNVNEGVIEVE